MPFAFAFIAIGITECNMFRPDPNGAKLSKKETIFRRKGLYQDG